MINESPTPASGVKKTDLETEKTPKTQTSAKEQGCEAINKAERAPAAVTKEVSPEIATLFRKSKNPQDTVHPDDPRANASLYTHHSQKTIEANPQAPNPAKDRLRQKRPLINTASQTLQALEQFLTFSGNGKHCVDKIKSIVLVAEALFSVNEVSSLNERATEHSVVLSKHVESIINAGEESAWKASKKVLDAGLQKFTRIALCIDAAADPIVQARIALDILSELEQGSYIPLCEADLKILKRMQKILRKGIKRNNESAQIQAVVEQALDEAMDIAIIIMISIISTKAHNKDQGYQRTLDQYYEQFLAAYYTPFRQDQMSRTIIQLRRYVPSQVITTQADFSHPFEKLDYNGTNAKHNPGERLATNLWQAVLTEQRLSAADPSRSTGFQALCQLAGHIIQMLSENEGKVAQELEEALTFNSVDFMELAKEMTNPSSRPTTRRTRRAPSGRPRPGSGRVSRAKTPTTPHSSPRPKSARVIKSIVRPGPKTTEKSASQTGSFSRTTTRAIMNSTQLRINLDDLKAAGAFQKQPKIEEILLQIHAELETEEKKLKDPMMGRSPETKALKGLAGKILHLLSKKDSFGVKSFLQAMNIVDDISTFAYVIDIKKSEDLKALIDKIEQAPPKNWQEEDSKNLQQALRYLEVGEKSLENLDKEQKKTVKEKLDLGIFSIIKLAVIMLNTSSEKKGDTYREGMIFLMRDIEVQAQGMEAKTVSDSELVQQATSELENSEKIPDEVKRDLLSAAKSDPAKERARLKAEEAQAALELRASGAVFGEVEGIAALFEEWG